MSSAIITIGYNPTKNEWDSDIFIDIHNHDTSLHINEERMLVTFYDHTSCI